jgi:SAM-dependent methyltransferase
MITSPILKDIPPEANEELAVKKLNEHGCVIERIHIPIQEFNNWQKRVDYENRFPIYFKEYGPPNQSPENWTRKQFEHFLTFKLSKINESSSVIDVAAANAPVQRILRDVFDISEAWRQDWNYTTDKTSKTLGGNASSLAVDDESFDALLLHNSWEHFEGDSDLDFLKEAARVLKTGGKVIITPLFFGLEGFVSTSPECWSHKYRAASEPPQFREEVPVIVNNSINQRYSQRHSVKLLLRHFNDVPRLSPKIIIISNAYDVGRAGRGL